MYSPEASMDIQPRSARILNVPEYYAEYRETGNGYAAFLGSSITAKVKFCYLMANFEVNLFQ